MIENDFLNTMQEIRLRGEVKDFVKTVDPELLRKMDRNEIEYPFEFLHEAAKRKLLGLRFPKEYGGRQMTWTAEMTALEEIGMLGMGLGCTYAMVSIVGEAINRFGRVAYDTAISNDAGCKRNFFMLRLNRIYLNNFKLWRHFFL